jgi:hypothetical protein
MACTPLSMVPWTMACTPLFMVPWTMACTPLSMVPWTMACTPLFMVPWTMACTSPFHGTKRYDLVSIWYSWHHRTMIFPLYFFIWWYVLLFTITMSSSKKRWSTWYSRLCGDLGVSRAGKICYLRKAFFVTYNDRFNVQRTCHWVYLPYFL